MMLELTDGYRYMPCGGCEGYVDTETEAFLAVIIPLRDGDQFRGKKIFHPNCYENRDRLQGMSFVTGVR